MKTFYLIMILFFCSTTVIFGQIPTQNIPQNPTEAYERAMKPVKDWFKSKESTLEGNIKANKEMERLAKEYANLFKVRDWKAKELFSLAQLYELAMQFADVEKALIVYLRAPADDKLIKPRTMLLLALINQKKISNSIPIAEQLLNESKYNQDIISYVQLLIDELRVKDIKRAIVIAEKRLPKLIKYAEDKIADPGQAASALSYALDLSSMYQETGNTAKSQAFVSSFLSQFNSSPLASNKRIKQSVDATLLRGNRGSTSSNSISNEPNQSQDVYAPIFSNLWLGGMENMPNANGQNSISIQNFRFGQKVPIKTADFKDGSGKSNSVVNYEQVGLSMERLKLNINVPTIIGSLATSKPDEMMFLILTIKPVEE